MDVVRLILEESTCSSGDESERSECSHDQDREVSRDAEGDLHLCVSFQAEKIFKSCSVQERPNHTLSSDHSLEE